MKAASFQEHGSIEKLSIHEVNKPKISANEVLIKTKFAALNHLDIFVINGWLGLNLEFFQSKKCKKPKVT
ncbi:MAG: hypothetical protein ACOC44_15495 [Promethearchaeia archaeon]